MPFGMRRLSYGHTPGHQSTRPSLWPRSLRLRLASDDIVLAGDSCYFCRTEPEVYKAVFRRMCQLVGFENDDPNVAPGLW
jgi:hypothetical protein